MKHNFLLGLLISLSFLSLEAADREREEPVDLVNPFIGTSNFGTTNPGAVCPNGLMSVVPFNVMGSDLNKYDKDARWWSTPYEYHNVFFHRLFSCQSERCGLPGGRFTAAYAYDRKAERRL